LIAARPKLQKWISDAEADDPESLGARFFDSSFSATQFFLKTLSCKSTIKSTLLSRATRLSSKEIILLHEIRFPRNLPVPALAEVVCH